MVRSPLVHVNMVGLHLASSVFRLSVLVGNFPLEPTMSDSIRSKVIKLAASFPTGSDARKSLLKVLEASTKSAATVPVSMERMMTATPNRLKVETPDWLKVGVRVQKNGDWPRVGLLDGTEGTVKSLDIDPVTGFLRWFTVVWDGLDDYKRGVEHHGWHSTDGNVTPAGKPSVRKPPTSMERLVNTTPDLQKVETPDWLKVGVRVRKNGDSPRFRLLDGTEGTVKSLDYYPSTKFLRWITVVWDGLDDYKRGVEHHGWHAVMGYITPVK